MEMKKDSKERGFSLIELIVVLVILGLLAGIVGPRVWDKVGTSKTKIAQMQIEQFGQALGMYRFDVGHYPTTSQGLRALVSNPGIDNWNGPYINKQNIPQDPWGREYQYRSPGLHGDYDLWSYGADGIEGGEGENSDVTSW